MKIGEAAAASGVSPRMIRHYEAIGLLPAAARRDSGYRDYDRGDLERLRFIAQARALGFGLELIGKLLLLWTDEGRASRDVRALAVEHLKALDEQAERVASLQARLRELIALCPGDDGAACPIVTALATPA